MALSPKQRNHLRARAHHLKPVVMIGNNGLSRAVLDEIDLALEHHELIKIRIAAGDRAERAAITAALCEQTGCETVQSIGRIAVVYRPATKPKIRLPAPA